MDKLIRKKISPTGVAEGLDAIDRTKHTRKKTITAEFHLRVNLVPTESCHARAPDGRNASRYDPDNVMWYNLHENNLPCS
jgi:hypothetical protein